MSKLPKEQQASARTLGLAGALGAIFVGGIVFAMLRLRTGNLAGSIVMHWAFNAILLVGIYTPTA